LAINSNFQLGTSFTLFAVFNFTTTTGYQSIYQNSRGTNAGGTILSVGNTQILEFGADQTTQRNISSGQGFTNFGTTRSVVSFHSTPASLYLYQNGSVLASNVTAATLPTTDVGPFPNIGGGYTDNRWGTGYFNEIICYTAELTTTQRQSIEGYLAWKWGLNNNLLPYSVTTLAGSTQGSTNATGTSATFFHPIYSCTDNLGNLYVCDRDNNRVRKIVISTGVVTTFAGSSQGSADGTGTGATFNVPNGIVYDSQGILYVADTNNHRIRKIVVSSGVVTTIAGSTIGFTDATGTSAQFRYPGGMYLATSDILYIADIDNNRIRKLVISTGVVTTLAGSGTATSTDGTGTGATFTGPCGVTGDGAGNLYIGENGQKIRKIVISSAVVTTLAGSGTSTFADGVGAAAGFYYPQGIVYDGIGNLYVGDAQNNRIRKIVIATASVTTIAGSATATSVDGTGATATFNYPIGVTLDSAGILYVCDFNGNRVRTINTRSIHPFYSTPAFSRPFGPTDIPGCALWLDGADSSTSSMTFSSGSNLSVWKDKSGAGNNFSLTAGTTSNILDGGYSVVNFPSGAIMTSANRITFTTSSAFFIVSKVTNTTYFCYLLGFSDIFSGDLGIKYLYGILTGTPASSQSYGAGELGSTTYYVNGSFNPNFGSNYYTNVYAIIDTVAPVSGGTSYLTLSSAFYSRYFIGNVAEFLFYPGGVTSSQRQQVEGYLAAKWGLLNNLPGKTLSPLNIPGCALWLDGADPLAGALPANGATVSTWYDKSGNGYNATGGVSPTYNSSQKAITFNGSSWLTTSYSSVPTNETAFIVFQTTTTALAASCFMIGPTNNGGRLLLSVNENDGFGLSFKIGSYFVANGSRIVHAQNQICLGTATVASTTSCVYLNGIQGPNSSLTYSGTGTTQIGTAASGGLPAAFYIGYIYEIVIYNTSLTTTQRQSVENYLMSKWGISNVTSHPFKSIPPSTSQPPQFQEVTPGNWTYDWKPYLSNLAAANSSGVTVTSSNLTGGGTYTANGWMGGVLAPNGNIYFAPYQATNILVLNPTTSVTLNLTGGATYTSSGWSGGVLAPNGNIYFVPNFATNILVLNPTTGVTSNLTGGATYTTQGWNGGVVAPNGNIYFAPRVAANFLVLNPTTGVTSNLTGGATYTTNGWQGAVLGPDGNIYCVPGNATNILVLNPITGVTSNLTGGGTYTTNGWSGGILAANGNIYFTPASATNILVLNTATKVTSNLTGGGTYTAGAWYGSVLGPTGNIYCVPSGGTNILVLNPTTGVTSNLTGGATYTSSSWWAGVLAPNGNIYCAPWNTTNVLKINFAGLSQTPSSSYCLSPYANKM